MKVLDTPLDNGGGTLNLLRKGFSHLAAKFQMCVFRPESTLNEKRNADYAAVRVRVMRQVHFSTADQRSVDLVFFVNGLPVATAELKTDFTQTVTDAITQYKTSRLPKDPAPGRSSRCSSPVPARWCTSRCPTTRLDDHQLAGDDTHFLPFNRGTEDGGAGNPLNPTGSKSAYLWERVLQRDAWLNILGRLMYIKHESTVDPISRQDHPSRRSAVPAIPPVGGRHRTDRRGHRGRGREALPDPAFGGLGQDQLASPGPRTGWPRLQVDDQKVFDSVIVVTDRNVLDAQLQDAIKQIDHDQGIVVAIDRDEAAKAGGESKSKSGLLAKALTTAS